MLIPAAIRRGAIRLRGLHYRLAGWPEADRPHIERVTKELELLVLPEVFPPSKCFSTKALIASLDLLDLPSGARALDVGTGSGAAAVHLARRGAVVDAVDINPAAVRCARANALVHGVQERLTVSQGDLFEPVRERRYDLIVFNPPYFDGAPTRWLEHAFYGGPGGEVIARFLQEAPAHLRPGGRVVLSYSTLANTERLARQIEGSAFTSKVLHSSDVVSEVVIHHLLSLPDGGAEA